MLDFQYKLQQRIRCKEDFDRTIKGGKRLFGDDFIFYYRSNDLSQARLGMLIGKKKCRLAVTRNQLRRQIREHFRLEQHALAGFDLVVTLKSMTTKALIQERIACLEKMFLQLHHSVSS